jgi:hypothetical protein
MAGNTRGKLKEQFEGIHKNFDWITVHCERALVLIKDHKPELSKAIKALDSGAKTLDKLAQGVYSKI